MIIGEINRTENFDVTSERRGTTVLKYVASFTNNGKSEAPEQTPVK
jgi:hypothetical protein